MIVGLDGMGAFRSTNFSKKPKKVHFCAFLLQLTYGFLLMQIVPLNTEDYNDDDFIDAVLKGGIGRTRVTDWFYQRYYAYVIEGKNKYKLSEDDAITAYLDAVSSVVQTIERGKFERKSKRR